MNTGFPKLDLAAIAKRYSTPLYFCNRAQILRNLHDFADLLGGANHILFPVKANPCLATLQIWTAIRRGNSITEVYIFALFWSTRPCGYSNGQCRDFPIRILV